MALQIEAPETIRLVEEVSRLSGENPEEVITAAVREQLKRLRAVEARIARRDELQALVDRLAARFEEPYRSTDPGEWLYEVDGLPR